MKCFSIDVRLIATAYILAETEEEAKKKANRLINESFEFSSSRQLISDDVWMTGETFNRDMPEVSLSPAMTCHGPNGGIVELAEDFDEEVECGQCEGTGTTDAMGHSEECPVCDGSGMIEAE